jgi:hypothetical protein
MGTSYSKTQFECKECGTVYRCPHEAEVCEERCAMRRDWYNENVIHNPPPTDKAPDDTPHPEPSKRPLDQRDFEIARLQDALTQHMICLKCLSKYERVGEHHYCQCPGNKRPDAIQQKIDRLEAENHKLRMGRVLWREALVHMRDNVKIEGCPPADFGIDNCNGLSSCCELHWNRWLGEVLRKGEIE